jgi:hypothetical protein
MQGGVLTSQDISMHTRVRTQSGTSPLTTARHMGTEILSRHCPSISPASGYPLILVPCTVSLHSIRRALYV